MDGDVFLAGVVEIFEQYPSRLVQRAVSAAFGLPKIHKFRPSIAEISAFLEDQMGPIRRQEERDARTMLPALPPPEKKPLDWTGLLTRLRTNEKTKTHWADVSANKLRGMAEFAATPDAPLRSGGKL